MALARWQATILDDAGNVVQQPVIEVRQEIIGQPLAVLYSDRDGAVPLGNAFTVALADNGFAAFHVIGGAYQITATKGAFIKVWRYVGIGTGSEFDLGALLTTVLTGAVSGSGEGTIETEYSVVPVAKGGTNAETEADARANLGLQIGVNVPAYSANLAAIAAITAALLLRSDVTAALAVGYTHTIYDHGTQATGAQAITPQPALNQHQKVTMAAGCALTITPPTGEGDVELMIINGGVTNSLTLSLFDKVFGGDTYSTAAAKRHILYINSIDGFQVCQLKAVN